MDDFLSFDEACDIVGAKLHIDHARKLLWPAFLRRELGGFSPDEADTPENRLFPGASRTPHKMSDADRQTMAIVRRDALMTWLDTFKSSRAEAVPSAEPMPDRNKGGGKDKWDWDAFELVFIERVERDGWPDKSNVEGWSSQADVARWLIELAKVDKKGEPSWPSAIRHARTMLQKHRGVS